MPLKGMDRFQAKAPAFSGKRFAILPVYVVLMLALSIAWMRLMYRLPGTLPSPQNATWLASLGPLFGFLLVGILGFLLASQMWFWKSFLKAHYGALSYQRILPFGLGGIVWVASLGIGLYLPFFLNLPSLWTLSPLAVTVMPLDALVGLGTWGVIGKGLLGLSIFCVGLAMGIRALTTFGLDYTAVVYLYFPEEGEMQKHAVYSVLRNPLYASMLLIGFGGVVAACTLYSLLLFALFLGGFYLFVHYVEEPELVARFGESFETYRKTTPMFFVRPCDLHILLDFIFDHENREENS